MRRRRAFAIAFHTWFASLLEKALGIAQRWTFAWLWRFHAPSFGVLVPSAGMMQLLMKQQFTHLRAWSHGIDDYVPARPPAPAANALQGLAG